MDLIGRLNSRELDDSLTTLYGSQGLYAGRDRCIDVCSAFEKTFGSPPEALFSAPGRTEIGGNHTDHQHGRVLAAAVDLDILAAVRSTGSGTIRLLSRGYPEISVDLGALDPRPGEENTSAALIRGVCARMRELGCPLEGAGFDICADSNVPGGSGLSSSAAFEVLIGTILNELCCGGRFTPVELAQIGQWAENVYFGKPCGLMDQTASSVGGVVSIDFADPDAPRVEKIDLDLTGAGYALCIMDSHASHADLTGEYAAITGELKTISGYFGQEVLRSVPEWEFAAAVPALRKLAGDRAVLRAIHYYSDNARAGHEAEALKNGDFDRFLSLVRESGCSSAMYLQNVVPAGQVTEQSLMLTLAVAEKYLHGKGAVRVHGGGFGGTAQAFVPLEDLTAFKSSMDRVLGEGSCHVVTIRPVGGWRIA